VQTCLLSDLRELSPYADDWDRLAGGVPFRTWAWLSTWWRHYRQERKRARLFVPCVFDARERLLGLAPWYVDESVRGRVVLPLGSGEVCSDYLGVHCQPGREESVAAALAEFLTGGPGELSGDAPGFDLIELTGVDAEDRAVRALASAMADRGNTVHVRPGPNCWRIALPESFDAYLAMLSKGHRKQLRRLERNLLQSGNAVFHEVRTLAELDRAAEMLIDLHQRRWRAAGLPGCFSSPAFTAFHRAVMPEMLRTGSLRLSWLEVDGRPAAAEYALAGGDVVYAYQSGYDPELRAFEPGRVAAVAAVRRAIDQGFRGYDFLRGDEPYKAHWRAARRPTIEVRIVPGRAGALLRHNLWLAGSKVKGWIKRGREPVASSSE
jgi:CelD/BcsL family acetyltransferase involved in cellulose biosynthesis